MHGCTISLARIAKRARRTAAPIDPGAIQSSESMNHNHRPTAVSIPLFRAAPSPMLTGRSMIRTRLSRAAYDWRMPRLSSGKNR
jgi:hypothetical protein